MNDINAAAAARAAEARRRAEEARRKAAEEAAKKRAAEAAAAKKAAAKLKVREKPSTRYEALKKEPTRRESKSTRYEATGKVSKKNDDAREVSAATRERYQQLNGSAETKNALEDLGVRSARDFQKLGDQYAAQLDGGGEKIEVARVQDKKALSRVLRATADTQTGDVAETMKNELVSKLVANGAEPEAAANSAPEIEKLGVTPDDLDELTAKTGTAELAKTIRALTTLADDGASKEDKTVAALDIGGKGGKLLPEDVRQKVLQQAFPNANKLLKAIDTLQDPKASGDEKAQAAIDFAIQAKVYSGKVLPEISRRLGRLDGPARIAGAALKLFDEDASVAERAIAAGQLGLGLSDLKYDAGKLTTLFKKARLPDAESIGRLGERLADLGSRGLDLDAVKKLPEAKLEELSRFAFKLDKQALSTLGPALEGLDQEATERFFKVASDMKPGALDEVLSNADEAKRFTETLAKLEPKHLDDFAQAASKMDGKALKLVTKLGAVAPASVVSEFMPALAKFGGGELVNKALGAMDKLLGVMKVDLTGPIAGKALKGLGKLLPGVSVGLSGMDVIKYGSNAANLQGKQDDLAFLAHTGMKLNALDAALEFIPGVGTLAGVGTGVAALALDLGFHSEKAKFEKDPKNYEAPGWVKAANIGVAMIGPPPGAGIPELIATYGPKDAAELGLWAVGQGGKLATAAWDVLKKIGGPAAEVALQAVEKLEDLGEKGAEALQYIAKAPGALGNAVAERAIEGLENLGEAGVEALKDIAKSGSAVAKKAAEGLRNLADDGLEAAKDALGTLKDVPGAVGKFVSGLGGLLPDIDLPGPL